jgi:class 3 adenylate cyclase
MEQDRPPGVERRLSAILAADVAGYSRLMHSDAEATHTKLAALLWLLLFCSYLRIIRKNRHHAQG